MGNKQTKQISSVSTPKIQKIPIPSGPFPLTQMEIERFSLKVDDLDLNFRLQKVPNDHIFSIAFVDTHEDTHSNPNLFIEFLKKLDEKVFSEKIKTQVLESIHEHLVCGDNFNETHVLGYSILDFTKLYRETFKNFKSPALKTWFSENNPNTELASFFNNY